MAKAIPFLSGLVWHVLEILFPRRCIFCKKIIAQKKEFLICDECEKEELLDIDDRSFEVIGHNAAYVASPFLYKDSVREAIIKFKFYSKPHYGKTLAHFMNDTLDEICRLEKFDLIVPVPLYKKKLRKRGYNQAEVLARELKASGAECDAEVLKKVKDHGTQSLKTAPERAEAVKGSFICQKSVEDKNVLLVDDICTTGVTLNYCAGELKKCGAKRVVCITAAKRYFY